MKLVHLSDLHLGKRVNEYSMIEDQKYILLKIREIIADEKPEAVIIAGDVYDKSVPSAEAVTLFDDFLSALSKMNTSVFVISGNHDSAERIAFGSGIMNKAGIFMSPVYDGNVEPVSLSDKYGEVCFYMLPFIKPIHVRQALGTKPDTVSNRENADNGDINQEKAPDEADLDKISSYNAAVAEVVRRMNVDKAKRNVLITHQFVTGASLCDSEDISVGGTDNVDASNFDDFDYAALGHIHGPQKCGRDTVRYCGTPLKYSFSEVNHQKSVTVVEMGEKGEIDLKFIDLIPKRDWNIIRGTYKEIMTRSFYEGTTLTDDYLKITLTDEEEVPEAMGKLRTVYKNIMVLEYDNTRTRMRQTIEGPGEVEKKSPMELFQELFFLQNNQELSDEQEKYATDLISDIWEGEK